MPEPNDIHSTQRFRSRFRERPNVEKTIGSSRSTILINIMIEFACMIILVIGVAYFIRILFYFRESMVELYFKFFLGAIIFFSVGWSVYLISKLKRYFHLFRQAGADRNPAEKQASDTSQDSISG